MSEQDIQIPEIVQRAAWFTACDTMQEREKEFASRREALTKERRRMPMMAMDEHVFEGRDGRLSLIDMFGNRRQLLV